MKASFAILLAACLAVEKAFGLVCWYCDGVNDNWGCWRWQFCSSSDNYCATTYIGAGIGGYSSQSITKGCVSVCPAGGINVGIAAASVSCCSSFLCNISGATSVQMSHAVLALGILASLSVFLLGPRL